MFDEFTRRACLESLDENSYGYIIVSDDKKEVEMSSWESDITFVQRILRTGLSQGKKMDFRVVVERQNGTLRFARKSEYIPSCRNKKNLGRVVKRQVSKTKVGRKFTGKIRTFS